MEDEVENSIEDAKLSNAQVKGDCDCNNVSS
jgi:hypothetical protein